MIGKAGGRRRRRRRSEGGRGGTFAAGLAELSDGRAGGLGGALSGGGDERW